MEGVSYLFLFSKIYGYDFGQESTAIFERMFEKAYEYAFDNLYLPNPNDGWPNLNLRTFSYVYHTAARAFGEKSKVGNLLKIIENDPNPRTTLPLSEPYYCCGTVCLEQLLFNIDFDYSDYRPVAHVSNTFPTSNFAMLRNNNWNVFVKYGLNGKSHAHPDIMNIEVMYKDQRISRDLSNAGYQSRLCNEWHRKTLSHNTVCWNGQDITSVHPGKCLHFDADSFRVWHWMSTRVLITSATCTLPRIPWWMNSWSRVSQGYTIMYSIWNPSFSWNVRCRWRMPVWAFRKMATSMWRKPKRCWFWGIKQFSGLSLANCG